MTDVIIDEIATNMDVTDAPAAAEPDMRRLRAAVMQFMREEAHEAGMHDQDVRIADRSWRSDVKPV